jgi:SAM-dependent methyltransferase
MTGSYYRRDNCRLCSGKNIEIAVPLAATPPADAYVSKDKIEIPQELYPLELFFCRDCGHVQLLDVVDPEVLFREYIYSTATSPGLVEYFSHYADTAIAQFRPGAGDLVVDIGSNDGTLLNFFKERGGLRALGVDPAKDIARKATEAGIETLPFFFSSAVAQSIIDDHGKASIITANNVFAHADELGEILEGIRQLLKEDGVFIFEVSYLVDMVKNMVFDWIYHEHLCYHNIRPLQLFFQRFGMELIDVSRTPSKGGSIHGIAQISGGPRRVEQAVYNMVEIEKAEGFDTIAAYAKYTDEINLQKSELLKILQKVKQEGGTMAGYGASATVTTLIYHFELGEYLDFIVDDNEARQGLFSPGHHIPVLAPESIYEKNVDYVVILAWRFVQPIISSHKRFIEGGGKFVAPLPQATIIE